MSQSEKHGVRGKLYLKRDWEESSSTHLEDQNDLYLEATSDEKSVVLVHAHGQKNFIRNSDSDYAEERLKISATQLIKFIRENGRRI